MKSRTGRRVLLAMLALGLLLQPVIAAAAPLSRVPLRDVPLRPALASVSAQEANDSFATAPLIGVTPVTGQLDADGDYEDIFAINLTRGERIDFTFNGPGADAYLLLWSPGGENVVAMAYDDAYPYTGYYVVPADGKYYLDACADAGSCTYTITYEKDSADVDDYTPGKALPASPATGTLTADTDDADIYSVTLSQGTRIKASINASAGADVSLVMFNKGTIDIWAEEPLAYSSWDDYPRDLVFTAPVTGQYYLAAMADAGSGNYRIDYTTGPVPAKTYDSVQGDNRYLTAVAASKKAFSTADCVIIATGENWPDALGGAALAAAKNGPILLTKSASLNPEVATEIKRLKAKEAFVLGGTSAVSAEVFRQVDALVGPTTRLGGDNRYQTAENIARRVYALAGEDFSGECYLATGANFPDALGASPLSAAFGAPILLVSPKGLTSGTMSTIAATGIGYATILGGMGAVPEEVVGQLEDADIWTERLEGDTRYETAAAVARSGWEYGLTYDKVAIATGQNFPDALAAGAMQAVDGSLMLLTPSGALDPNAAAALKANKWDIDTVRFMGGTSALSTTVRNSVKAALK